MTLRGSKLRRELKSGRLYSHRRQVLQLALSVYAPANFSMADISWIIRVEP